MNTSPNFRRLRLRSSRIWSLRLRTSQKPSSRNKKNLFRQLGSKPICPKALCSWRTQSCSSRMCLWPFKMRLVMSSGTRYFTNSSLRHTSTTCKLGIMKLLHGVMMVVTNSLVLTRRQFRTQARLHLQQLNLPQLVRLQVRPPHQRKLKAGELQHQLLVERLTERTDTSIRSSNSQLLTMNSLTTTP